MMPMLGHTVEHPTLGRCKIVGVRPQAWSPEGTRDFVLQVGNSRRTCVCRYDYKEQA